MPSTGNKEDVISMAIAIPCVQIEEKKPYFTKKRARSIITTAITQTLYVALVILFVFPMGHHLAYWLDSPGLCESACHDRGGFYADTGDCWINGTTYGCIDGRDFDGNRTAIMRPEMQKEYVTVSSFDTSSVMLGMLGGMLIVTITRGGHFY